MGSPKRKGEELASNVAKQNKSSPQKSTNENPNDISEGDGKKTSNLKNHDLLKELNVFLLGDYYLSD